MSFFSAKKLQKNLGLLHPSKSFDFDPKKLLGDLLLSQDTVFVLLTADELSQSNILTHEGFEKGNGGLGEAQPVAPLLAQGDARCELGLSGRFRCCRIALQSLFRQRPASLFGLDRNANWGTFQPVYSPNIFPLSTKNRAILEAFYSRV